VLLEPLLGLQFILGCDCCDDVHSKEGYGVARKLSESLQVVQRRGNVEGTQLWHPQALLI